MTFEAPIWLYLTPLLTLAAAGLVAIGFRQRHQLLSRFAAARLLEQLTEKASLHRKLSKALLVIFGFAFIGLALARPQYGVEWSQQKARGLDIIFVLDSSKSMLATDLRPTRLDRAKLAILDLIDRLESDRIGLVAFAGQAFLQTPATLDYAAFRESLEATDPSMLSRGGSDLGRALDEAAQAFPNGDNVKVVVLLTDGEDLRGRAIEAAREAADSGIQVFAIGIGTPQGEYLRVRNAEAIEEFIRDEEGQPVRSQLDESTLQEIAQITGGSYARLGDGTLNKLYDSVLSSLPREERVSELKEIKIERFQWLIACALLALTVEMVIRRRAPKNRLAAILLPAALLPSFTPKADAREIPAGLLNPWPQVIATAENTAPVDPNTSAYESMQNGNYTAALKFYESIVCQSADKQDQRDALYNMGHAQHQIARQSYQSGDAAKALEEIRKAESYFSSAGEIDPGDAIIQKDVELVGRVREAIEKIVKQQAPQESEQQDQEKQEDREQNQEQNSNNQEKSSGGEEASSSGENASESQGKENQNSGEQNPPDGLGQEAPREEEQGNAASEDNRPEQDSDSGEEEKASSTGDHDQSQDETTGEAMQRSDSRGNQQESGDRPESVSQTEEAEPPVQESSQEVPTTPSELEGETENQSDVSARGDQAVQMEGMSIEEAQDLLDSLRSNEEMLPFTQAVPGQNRPLRDW